MLLIEKINEIGMFRTKTIVHLRIAISFAWETIKGPPHTTPPAKPSCCSRRGQFLRGLYPGERSCGGGNVSMILHWQ